MYGNVATLVMSMIAIHLLQGSLMGLPTLIIFSFWHLYWLDFDFYSNALKNQFTCKYRIMKDTQLISDKLTVLTPYMYFLRKFANLPPLPLTLPT